MLTAIVTVIIFLVLISLHEFGHFIMAKISGVKVLEFSVGMGPAILKKQGRETLYSLRIFPVGGYCKLEGEDQQAEDERAFCNQPVIKRILVVSAGAILNLVLGFVLFIVMTLIQPTAPGEDNKISTTVVDSVIQGSYLEETGIMSGDKIIGIDGHKIRFYHDIPLYTDKFAHGEQAKIEVKRNGEKLSFDVMPSLHEVIYNYGENSVEVITKINNQQNSSQIIEYAEKDRESIKDYIGTTQTDKAYIIGFTPRQEKVGVNNIFSYSYHYTGYVVRMVYKAFWDLITGNSGLENLSGPVGIVTAVNTAVNSGRYMLINILSLAALLTINLGIFNLLPLPALDGGRLFFMLVELVTRKRIPTDKEGIVHAIGLVLLLALSVIISFNDIIKLIK